jgi:hypothetical protein
MIVLVAVSSILLYQLRATCLFRTGLTAEPTKPGTRQSLVLASISLMYWPRSAPVSPLAQTVSKLSDLIYLLECAYARTATHWT